MNDVSHQQRVAGVIAAIFRIPAAQVPQDGALRALPGWDSLRHLKLVLAIEDEFGLRLSEDTVESLYTIADLRTAAGER